MQAAHTESDPVKPWSMIAKYKHQVEKKLQTIPGLRYTIVRPAIVYGMGDKTGLGECFITFFLFCHMGYPLII